MTEFYYNEHFNFGQTQQIEINEDGEHMISEHSVPFIKIGAIHGNVVNTELYNPDDKKVVSRLQKTLKVPVDNPCVVYNNNKLNDEIETHDSLVYKSGYKIEKDTDYEYKFQDKLKLTNGFWNYTTKDGKTAWYAEYENVGNVISDDLNLAREKSAIPSIKRYLSTSNYKPVFLSPDEFKHRNTSLQVNQNGSSYSTTIYGQEFVGASKNKLSSTTDIIQQINGYSYYKVFTNPDEYITRTLQNNVRKVNYVYKIGFSEDIPQEVKRYDDVEILNATIKLNMSNIYNNWLTSIGDVYLNFGSDDMTFQQETIDDNFGCVREYGGIYYYRNNSGGISKTRDYKTINPTYNQELLNRYLAFKPKESITRSKDISLLFYPEIVKTNYISKVYKTATHYINKLPYDLKLTKPIVNYGYINKQGVFTIQPTVTKQDIWIEDDKYYVPTFSNIKNLSNKPEELLGNFKKCDLTEPIENLRLIIYVYESTQNEKIYSNEYIEIYSLKISKQPSFAKVITKSNNMNSNYQDITDPEHVALSITLEETEISNPFIDCHYQILREDCAAIITKSIIENLYFYDDTDSLFVSYDVMYPERRLFVRGYVETNFSYRDILKTLNITNKDYSISTTKSATLNLEIEENATTIEDGKLGKLTVDSNYIKHDIIERLDSNTKFFDIEIYKDDGTKFEDNGILETLLNEPLEYSTEQDYTPGGKFVNVVCSGVITIPDAKVNFEQNYKFESEGKGGKIEDDYGVIEYNIATNDNNIKFTDSYNFIDAPYTEFIKTKSDNLPEFSVNKPVKNKLITTETSIIRRIEPTETTTATFKGQSITLNKNKTYDYLVYSTVDKLANDENVIDVPVNGFRRKFDDGVVIKIFKNINYFVSALFKDTIISLIKGQCTVDVILNDNVYYLSLTPETPTEIIITTLNGNTRSTLTTQTNYEITNATLTEVITLQNYKYTKINNTIYLTTDENKIEYLALINEFRLFKNDEPFEGQVVKNYDENKERLTENLHSLTLELDEDVKMYNTEAYEKITGSFCLISSIDSNLDAMLYDVLLENQQYNRRFLIKQPNSEDIIANVIYTKTEHGYNYEVKLARTDFIYYIEDDSTTFDFVYVYEKGRPIKLNIVIGTPKTSFTFNIKNVNTGETKQISISKNNNYVENIFDISDKIRDKLKLTYCDYKYHIITTKFQDSNVEIPEFWASIESMTKEASETIKEYKDGELVAEELVGSYIDDTKEENPQILILNDVHLPGGKYSYKVEKDTRIYYLYKQLPKISSPKTNPNDWELNNNIYIYKPSFSFRETAKTLGECNVSVVEQVMLEHPNNAPKLMNEYYVSYIPIKHDAYIRFGNSNFAETISNYYSEKDLINTYPEYANNLVLLQKCIELKEGSPVDNMLSPNTQFTTPNDEHTINLKILDKQILQYSQIDQTIDTRNFDKIMEIKNNLSIGFEILNSNNLQFNKELFNISGNDIGISCCMTIGLNGSNITDADRLNNLSYGIYAFEKQNNEIIIPVVIVDKSEIKCGKIGNLKIRNIGDYLNLDDCEEITTGPNYKVEITFDFICTRKELGIISLQNDVDITIKFKPVFDFFLPGEGLALTFKPAITTNDPESLDIPLQSIDLVTIPTVNIKYKPKDTISKNETELTANIKTVYFNAYNTPYTFTQFNNPNECFGVETEISTKSISNIPKTTEGDEFLTQITQKIDNLIVNNNIAKIRIDFFNKTTGENGQYSYKSYGYVLLDTCDFDCCKEDFNVKSSLYNINFKALKNLFTYTNGKIDIPKSVDKAEYNDNIVVYEKYKSEKDGEWVVDVEIPEIRKLLNELTDTSKKETVLHSSLALLTMFKNYPNGFFEISLILDYYSDPIFNSQLLGLANQTFNQSQINNQQTQQLQTNNQIQQPQINNQQTNNQIQQQKNLNIIENYNLPIVGKYQRRHTVLIKSATMYNYIWDSINKYNCRQFVSYPNSMPYDAKRALAGITDENYNNQFIGTFVLKSCGICKFGCCDGVENKGESTETEEEAYKIHAKSRPKISEQGDMVIERELLDKTPIYITTMLPEDKRDNIDGIMYSAQLLNGVILFNDMNGKTIQTNTYTVTYRKEDNNPVINLKTVDSLGHEKTYTINTEIVELVDIDLGFDENEGLTYGRVKRLNDKIFWELENVYSSEVDKKMNIMKQGIYQSTNYYNDYVLYGNEVITSPDSNPTLYLTNNLYVPINNDKINKKNVYEYTRRGNFNPDMEKTRFIPYWTSQTISNIKTYPIADQNQKKDCDFDIVNKSDTATDGTVSFTQYTLISDPKSGDAPTLEPNNAQYNIFKETKTLLSCHQMEIDGKLQFAVQEKDIETKYKQMKDFEIFFADDTVYSPPYGRFFIGNLEKITPDSGNQTTTYEAAPYILGKLSDGTTIKRQLHILQDINNVEYLNTDKHVLNSIENFISVGMFKQVIQKVEYTTDDGTIDTATVYVNVFFNTYKDEETTQYKYHLYITCDKKILENGENNFVDTIEKYNLIDTYNHNSGKLLNNINFVEPGFLITAFGMLLAHDVILFNGFVDKSNLYIPIKNLYFPENVPRVIEINPTVLKVNNHTAITVIKENSITTTITTNNDDVYFNCTDTFEDSLYVDKLKETITYPSVPCRKYLTFYVPVENDYGTFNNVKEFNVNINDFTTSYKNSSFLASGLEDKIRNYPVLIKDSGKDPDIPTPEVEDESQINLLDSFFIDIGKYSNIEELVDKINSSVKANLEQSVNIIDETQLSFKDYMSLNVAAPKIVLAIDVNNRKFNIIVDYEDFDLYDFSITFKNDKKYTIMYEENGKSQILIARFKDMQEFVLKFIGDNSTFNAERYFNQLEVVMNINIPNTFPVVLTEGIDNAIIADKFFNDIIVQNKKMLTITKSEGRYKVEINSEIIPVEFTSESIPENIDYLRLVKKYQNYQQNINENSGKLSTFDIRTILNTPFTDSNKEIVDYLSVYFNSENFGISFKHNVHGIWYKLGFTPIKIDKNKRPCITGPDTILSIIQTNLFSSFNKIIWYNYLSSEFVETSYLSDEITLPHPYIISRNNSHVILEGKIKLSEHPELFNSVWETENRPRLNVPLEFSVKTTRNPDVEYTLNIGNNETTISDIDTYTVDDNKQMKLNIYQIIDTKEISKMYIYLDSSEHYPFDTGANATLSVEWIK